MTAVESNSGRDALASLRIPHRDDPPRRSSWVRWMGALALLLFVLAAAYGAYAWLRPDAGPVDVMEWVPAAIRNLPEVRVTRAVVERGRVADALVVATGYLESRRQAQIGARAAGRIEDIAVEEGTRVARGDMIAVLEHKDMDAALAAAQAELAGARAQLAEHEVEIARTKNDYDRAAKLRESRSISVEEFDRARFVHQGAVARRASLSAAVLLAEARVQQAEQLNENMMIRAPFDGTIISKNAEVGESILPGGMGEASGRGSVVTIADLDHLEVDCDVKEDYIGRVQHGTPAEVAVDAVPGKRYQGRVRKIIPMGDRARATIKVKVEILDGDAQLFPDMSSTVYFLPPTDVAEAAADDGPRVFCDTAAVQSAETGSFVWLLTDEKRVEQVAVEPGEQRDGRTEITAGLDGGETLVLNPPPDLRPGALVRITE